ncbi:MAG TPA: hypothetical protein VD704_11930 [Gaiellaceae bacterium]|nr:hypothetical protein [Gaiellaceae bacterium]
MEQRRRDGAGGSRHEPVSFLGRRLPRGFALCAIVVPPGGRRRSEDAPPASLLVVEHGEVELVCPRGGRCRLVPGCMLWPESSPGGLLVNSGTAPAVLVAVWRRGTDEFRPPPPSDG